jgi:hypothetical protein
MLNYQRVTIPYNPISSAKSSLCGLWSFGKISAASSAKAFLSLVHASWWRRNITDK